MRKFFVLGTILMLVMAFIFGCKKSTETVSTNPIYPTPTNSYPAILAAFGNNIDLNNLANYAIQSRPAYIVKVNFSDAQMSNAKATLGRVLFYDNQLSINNSVSCASCHKQAFAFSDTANPSLGVLGGVTVRHSMRLVNVRFANETRFFWNKRASSLENQVTQPIKDHAEMGFSGTNGRPGFDSLINKLKKIAYYNELFQYVYGDQNITEPRLQESLSAFVRSIQSFDSKYDAGRAQVQNDNQPFPNFTTTENLGKQLFINPPVFNAQSQRIAGGLGCNGCHQAPEFDIDPNTRNNGIISIINNVGVDLTNTKAPVLRDVAKSDGTLNGGLMHTGGVSSLHGAVNHYNSINVPNANTNLDPRLMPNGIGQQLNVTTNEFNAMVAFLKTLAGTNIYTDPKWSNPFK